jgi:hypothetical protein
MPASKDELVAAMHRIYDALRFMRGPTGDLIYVGEKAMEIAWHLARAGTDVHAERAVIKAVPVPDRPGQFAGMVDWAPWDWTVPPERLATHPPSALAPDVDLAAMDDALPWHVKTKIEGAFK